MISIKKYYSIQSIINQQLFYNKLTIYDVSESETINH